MGRTWGVIAVLILGWGTWDAAPSAAQSPGFDLLVSSRATNSVKRYDGVTGDYVGDFIAAGAGGLGATQEVLVAPNGNLIVSGRRSSAILEFHPKTGAFIGPYTSGYTLRDPTKMSWGPDGDLYVSQWAGSNTVARFDGESGSFIEEVTPSLDRPMQAAWDGEGALYVAVFGTGEVLRYDPLAGAGSPFTTGLTLQGPVNLWFEPSGTLTVVDWTGGTLERFDGATGEYRGRYVEGLSNPEGLAIGPDGRLYVADWTGQRVNAYDPDSGEFLETFASGGGLGDPNSILFIERFADFTIDASASALSVASGGSGEVMVSVAPDRDLPFDQPIQLSCQGLHDTASCAFDPPVLTPSDTAAASLLTISATAAGDGPALFLLPLLLLLALLGAAWRATSAQGPSRARAPRVRPRVALVFSFFWLFASCGDDGGPIGPGNDTETRSVAIQATSGDITHSTNLSLTLTGVSP